MKSYVRPLVQVGNARPDGALALCGGWGWFSHVELLRRGEKPEIVPASGLSPAALKPLVSERPAIAGIDFGKPRIMGILNTTPDSFSDGGNHTTVSAALKTARDMVRADIIDVGGESTRPGAVPVSAEDEIARTAVVIERLTHEQTAAVISIDTRKTAVASAALQAGAHMVNDVSGFTYDPDLGALCAQRDVPVCVMHTQGDPTTMQDNPVYDDVVLDVFDFLAQQIAFLEDCGVPRCKIIADPGIGFGKTLEHNLALLERISVFHGLGVPILLGASRKRFVGTLSGVAAPAKRLPGSLGVALAAVSQGVQILRVHDVPQSAQAIALWRAAMAGKAHE